MVREVYEIKTDFADSYLGLGALISGNSPRNYFVLRKYVGDKNTETKISISKEIFGYDKD